jgi:hypothetical protein
MIARESVRTPGRAQRPSARTRVNANTAKTVAKKNGKVTTSQRSEVSSDGKTRTVTTTGMNGAGQAVNNVAVYDKQ